MSAFQSLLSTLLSCLVLTGSGPASGHEFSAARPARTEPCVPVRVMAVTAPRALTPASDQPAVRSSNTWAQGEPEPGCEADEDEEEDDEDQHLGRPRAHLLDTLDLAAGSLANAWTLLVRAPTSAPLPLFLLHGRLTC